MTDEPIREDSLHIELAGARRTRPHEASGDRPPGSTIGTPALGAVPISIEPTVVIAAWDQVLSNASVEVGGVLLGRVHETFVLVEAILDARHIAHTSGSLTFTHATWSDFAERIEREHRTRRIVGWYHSHPGHGIFLSGMDLFIHENFFAELWQSAWVLDPLHRTEGLFQWSGGKIVESGYERINDQIELLPGSRFSGLG